MTHLYVAIIAAIIAAGSTWQIQNWRFDAKELKRVEQQAAVDRESRTFERKRSENVIAAQNTARVREQALRRDADLARSESDGLRNDITVIRNQLPGLTDESVRKYADTVSVVFDQCSRKYQDMAGAASGHASDVQTMTDAWPK